MTIKQEFDEIKKQIRELQYIVGVGRKPRTKNKKKDKHMSILDTGKEMITTDRFLWDKGYNSPELLKLKRGKGRPKGSKNKKKI